MANYHEYSLLEATDPEAVGTGSGDPTSGVNGKGPEGELRICISLGATPIAWPEGQRPEGYADWISCTEPVAIKLLEHLAMRFPREAKAFAEKWASLRGPG